MNGKINHRSSWQSGLQGLVLCAFLVARLLAPSGFMPVLSSQGFAIELCTGHGLIALNPDTPGKKQAPNNGAPDCPFSFAATSTHVLTAFVFTAVAILLSSFIFFSGAIADLVLQRLAVPPPSQGPPHIL